MKIASMIFVAVVAVACAIGGEASAGFSRAAQMSGYDATYRSTGRCVQGACWPKNPLSRRVWPSHQQ